MHLTPDPFRGVAELKPSAPGGVLDRHRPEGRVMRLIIPRLFAGHETSPIAEAPSDERGEVHP